MTSHFEPLEDGAWVVEELENHHARFGSTQPAAIDADWDEDDEEDDETDELFANWPHDIGQSSSDFLIRRRQAESDADDSHEILVLKPRSVSPPHRDHEYPASSDWEILLLGTKSQKPTAVLRVPSLATALDLVNPDRDGWPKVELADSVSRERASLFPYPDEKPIFLSLEDLREWEDQ
jgi:hypothetical protein